MGGGLMQLVATGAADVYLTGNPQITFFKVVYRRHTNFASESIAQVFNGNANFGNTVNCTVSRNGDLVTNMVLECELPVLDGSANWHAYVGHRLVEQVSLEIGGQKIDKHLIKLLITFLSAVIRLKPAISLFPFIPIGFSIPIFLSML